MNKALTIVVVVLLLLATLASIGGAVYFYSKLNTTSGAISTLQSQNDDLEGQLSTLESTIDDVEEQFDQDLDGDEKIVDTPTRDLDADPCENASSDGEILVTKPCAGDSIGSEFQLEGKARVFEATFQVSIVSSRGVVLFQNTYMTTGGDIGQKNPFNETVTWNSPGTGRGFVNVYELSAKDGSTEHLVSVPVKFQ